MMRTRGPRRTQHRQQSQQTVSFESQGVPPFSDFSGSVSQSPPPRRYANLLFVFRKPEGAKILFRMHPAFLAVNAHLEPKISTGIDA